jgi:biotin synthase
MTAAVETARLGASEFCIVLAVRGPDERILARLEHLVPLVARESGLQGAVSAGILSDDQAARLAAVGMRDATGCLVEPPSLATLVPPLAPTRVLNASRSHNSQIAQGRE